jgi:hypothetical protein
MSENDRIHICQCIGLFVVNTYMDTSQAQTLPISLPAKKHIECIECIDGIEHILLLEIKNRKDKKILTK